MKFKHRNIILKFIGLTMATAVALSCSKEFLTRIPVGQISEADLNNKAGVNGLLIGAYALLDGSGLDNWMIDNSSTSITNPWLGSVGADDAHKGGGNGSQPFRGTVQNKAYIPTNDIFNARWRFYYAAVQRSNDVLRQLAKVPDGQLTDAEAQQIIAEARFLRGFYHYELAKSFYNIPFVDETITAAAGNFKVPNSPDPSNPTGWDEIAEDFIFAADVLPGSQTQIGRAHKWAAKAMLAKTYMQRANLEAAKPILEDIITNGTNSSGAALALETKFRNIYSPDLENGPEAVFSVQMSVNDGALGRNGNDGDVFSNPPFSPVPGTGGWAHQPSFNLANAYKTTASGLPEFDTFNDVNLKNNFQDLSPVFVPDNTIPLDPRLDWTVARQGIPFNDWGLMNQARNAENGPYYTKKFWLFLSEIRAGDAEVVEGWKLATGLNFPFIRFSDVLLMAAECEVEIGSLAIALGYVNQVRTRAANPAGFLKTYVDPAVPANGFTNTPAANYVIDDYPSFPDKAYARRAVRFERRLELATEGHRFFDLQRFDRIDKKYQNEQTYMARILNAYMTQEAAIFLNTLGSPHGFLQGATFTAGKHEIYALPQDQIDQSQVDKANTLTQNPGH